MIYDLLDQPQLWVAGVATRTRNADELDPERARLSRLWEHAAPDGPMIAVLTDYESGRNGEYTQVVGRVIADPAHAQDGEVIVRVPAGQYGRVSPEGTGPASIITGWQAIWAAEESGALTRSYRTDFEVWPTAGSPTIHLGLS